MQQARRQAELQNQASLLIQQGQFQQAIRLLEGLSGRHVDVGPTLQLLDLQVRLKDDEGARRSMDSLSLRLPAKGGLATHQDFQIAGALAGAYYRLGQPARAAEQWNAMKEQAGSESLALAVFHSYRQVGLIDEALAWAREQRRRTNTADLWALDLAQLHESAGRPRESFDELARWQCRQQGGGQLVESRLLTLAEGAADRPALLDHMLKRLDDRRESCPALGEAVLGVLVQQGWIKEAVALAWRLDGDSAGALPFDLARDLARDGRHAQALALMDDLARRGRPQASQADFLMLRAESMAALGRPGEALDQYRRVARESPLLAGLATLRAAGLLHRPLGRLPEAVAELEGLLAGQPGNRQAAILLVQLRGCQGNFDGARLALKQLRERSRLSEEEGAELTWLGLRLEWWAGELNASRQGLADFLKTNTRQNVFNDAIEMMDLLAYGATDSLAVVEAAHADRLAFAGQWRQALAQLHATAERSKGRLAEWLDWRACQVATGDMSPSEAREEYRRYRGRQQDSIRLDRLAWMELEAMERQGLPADSLRAQAMDLLRMWPDTMLQDAARRRLREWGAPPVEGGTPPVMTNPNASERPR